MRRPVDCAPRILRGRTSMGLERASLPRKSRSTTRRRVWRTLRSSLAFEVASARRLHTGFLGDLGPLADLALEARGKLLRRAADGIGAFACIRSLISGVLSTRMVSPAILFTTSFGVPVSIKWMTRCDH